MQHIGNMRPEFYENGEDNASERLTTTSSPEEAKKLENSPGALPIVGTDNKSTGYSALPSTSSSSSFATSVRQNESSTNGNVGGNEQGIIYIFV